MSEPTPKQLPADFPIVEPTPKGVNIRRAMAGIHLLNGEGSQLRCLVKAGYSRATARNLTQAGLRAETCLAEAAKLDGIANPGKLLEAGRARAMLAIQACDPVKVPLRDTMKMLDTVEKYYGNREIPPGNTAIGVAARLADIVAMLVVARERGLPVPPLPASFIEAELVATEPVKVLSDNIIDAVSHDGTTR